MDAVFVRKTTYNNQIVTFLCPLTVNSWCKSKNTSWNGRWKFEDIIEGAILDCIVEKTDMTSEVVSGWHDDF